MELGYLYMLVVKLKISIFLNNFYINQCVSSLCHAILVNLVAAASIQLSFIQANVLLFSFKYGK